MYVCVCVAATERDVRQAVQGGAKTLRDLRHHMGVTAECGRCAGCVKRCIRDVQQSCETSLEMKAA